jgi:hypothetical protein
LVIDRSATAVIVVVSVAELFVETGSFDAEAIVAVLERDPVDAVTVVPMVMAGGGSRRRARSACR